MTAAGTTRDAPLVRVLVLGGGYSGIMAANRLAGKVGKRVSITMISPNDTFVERIRLHEVAARHDTETASRWALRDLVHHDVRLRTGTVTRIDPDARVVHARDSASGEHWSESYDRLVYAVGSGSAVTTVPGSESYAHSITNLAAARDLRARLDELSESGSVLIVGGGTTAIELSTELAAARPHLRLRLVTSGLVGPTLSERGRDYLRGSRAFTSIELHENTRVAEVTPEGVVTQDGRTIKADCVVWAASFAVPSLARDSGLDVDGAGRLVVDDTMRTTIRPEILGAGDGCVITSSGSGHLRMACATAAPQGAHAAATVVTEITGRPAPSFRLAYLVVAMSLGPHDGLVQRTRPDDTPRNTVITGRPGAWFNELNNRYARQILAWERQRAGAYHWAKPPKRQAKSVG
jgi:NADH dehydrogenase FAD-containing subunit